jgi:aryl-alcohol dehydrogenase-like predicted oxidoreductase
MDHTSRRAFLERITAGIAVTVAGLPLVNAAETTTKVQGIPYRNLGRSSQKVSLIGLGGYHIGVQSTVEESIKIVRTALDSGMNFLDNCWDYNGGESEVRMGKALRDGYRQKAFLMTKMDGQVKDVYTRQLEDSLRRLQTDHIDLVQFHEVIRPGDPARIFGPGGAFEAAVAARKAGKIRFIGFTGHKDPAIHLKMIQTGLDHGFTFDSVQMPLNLMDAHYRSFAHQVVPVAVKHGIGVLGMKPLANGILMKSNTVSAIEALHYAMNLKTSVVINGCDTLDRLSQALEAARTFKPLTEAQLTALLSRTAAAGESGKYEPFKNTHMFDGTYHNPEWLG